MTASLIFALLLVMGVFLGIPVVLLVRLDALKQRILRLESDVALLKFAQRGRDSGVAPQTRIEAAPEPVFAAPEKRWQPQVPATLAAETNLVPGPDPIPVAPAAAPLPGRQPDVAARAPLDASSFEQLVGGVWLQNVGAVLLLLGTFLMIVWGYSTGRFGPQVLVAGGVALGFALAWRGNAAAQRTPRFGHALIGVGLGVIYLTLYLGHIQLHVFGQTAALALLALVSFGAIVTGLRYRVQAIAAFGVIGAFLPQFVASWLALPGFAASPAFLLGYLAITDLLVFALAARAGWSGLDLVAIGLSALTWLTAFHGPAWGWGIQTGLAGLFLLLGLAPLRRLVRVEGHVRAVDLAVVAVAPLALLAASAPFLASAGREWVAAHLFALAAVMLGAALWVDARRPERDLWLPLTAAATLFITGGLERAVGPVYTAVAWAVEGVVLLLLGLRPGAGWLRAMGHLVLSLCVIALVVHFDAGGWPRDRLPGLYGAAVNDVLCVLALLVAARVLARGRDRLGALERRAPEAWTVMGHLLLACWFSNQANHLAAALTEGGGGLLPVPPPSGVSVGERKQALAMALSAVAWAAQSATLAWRGSQRGFSLRLMGAMLGFVAMLFVFFRSDGGWWTDLPPFVHPVALLDLLAVAIAVAVALRYGSRRDRLMAWERRTPEVWAAMANVALMAWSARETRHLAQLMMRPDSVAGTHGSEGFVQGEHALRAALASIAWLLQAVTLLTLGWLRHRAFLRWAGLTLLGITLLKFLVFDLQTVDVFWRFLTAIAVGVAMLALSYAYQRKTKRATAAD